MSKPSERQLRAITLLEEENAALRAQLKAVKEAVADLSQLKTDDSRDLQFFSESYLYEKLGKEDARTVRYAIEHIMHMCSLDETGAKAILRQNRAFENLFSRTYNLNVLHVPKVHQLQNVSSPRIRRCATRT